MDFEKFFKCKPNNVEMKLCMKHKKKNDIKENEIFYFQKDNIEWKIQLLVCCFSFLKHIFPAVIWLEKEISFFHLENCESAQFCSGKMFGGCLWGGAEDTSIGLENIFISVFLNRRLEIIVPLVEGFLFKEISIFPVIFYMFEINAVWT